jgi:hypothetical protein
MSELSGWEDTIGPFFKVIKGQIITRTDNSTFIDSTYEFNNNFFRSMIINDLEFSNVSVDLHNFKELNNKL